MPYTVEQTTEGIRFAFRYRPPVWIILVLGIFTTFAWAGLLKSRHEVLKHRLRDWSDALIAVLLLCSLIAALFGKEIIEVSHAELLHRSTYLGLGWTSHFALSDVLDPQYEPEDGYGRNKIPSHLRFVYHGRTRRILKGVDPGEVEAILKEIVERYPHLSGRWKVKQSLYGSQDVLSLNI